MALQPIWHAAAPGQQRPRGKTTRRSPHPVYDEGVDQDGTPYRECLYTPNSLRATAATELLIAGVDIMKVNDLLGHRHVTTTQIYDKRRRSTSERASHDVPI